MVKTEFVKLKFNGKYILNFDLFLELFHLDSCDGQLLLDFNDFGLCCGDGVLKLRVQLELGVKFPLLVGEKSRDF